MPEAMGWMTSGESPVNATLANPEVVGDRVVGHAVGVRLDPFTLRHRRRRLLERIRVLSHGFAGTVAHDADDHIIYNNKSGTLYYDSDGTGAHVQVLIATIANHAHVGLASNFVLI